ncbi:hypothetical protein BDV23DRAFT_168176 [Aspergillus alliaceus]|uniref:Fucose-specific lectin n=1 Tax=Petromyces alliaceus TaxID=209559 RepID=A0A5N7CQ03_PETAA|nr:hypothetical protein BDV23DRAFT_168176 [Aspergillus alliaceus]
MSSLVNTALAAVTTNGKDSYLYYQSGQEIREAHSETGSSWTAVASTVATNASGGGSALTAYYVNQDADFGKQATIHVIYLDSSAKVADKVKVLSKGKWEDGQTSGIETNPASVSRITGGAFNGTTGWNPNGSQWAYYNTPSGNELQITEIRRTPNSPWHTETVLPEKKQALPGTDLATSIVNGTIDLYYQDHAGNVNHWLNQDSQWKDDGVLIQASNVQISTPLATVNAGKKHVFYVDKSSPSKIKDRVDGKDVEVANFYPGTRLAALSVDNKVTLFYKILNPAGAIATKVYTGSSWADGSTVVPA